MSTAYKIPLVLQENFVNNFTDVAAGFEKKFDSKSSMVIENTKAIASNYDYSKMIRFVLKNIKQKKKKWLKLFKTQKLTMKVKKQKLRAKKYGEIRSAAQKITI